MKNVVIGSLVEIVSVQANRYTWSIGKIGLVTKKTRGSKLGTTYRGFICEVLVENKIVEILDKDLKITQQKE